MSEWQLERQNRPQKPSTWMPRSSQPPDVGVIEGTDHVVSFKTGNQQGGRTIISDGDYSDDGDAFDKQHNDYGSLREGPGYFDEDRGWYTGPYH